ncbi:MAG: hypothetical protein RLZ98_2848, partial [Pseudomonadota bacterium]
AQAQRRVPPPSEQVMRYSFAPVVKKVTPAVVNVYVSARVQSFTSPFANDPFFRRFFGDEFGGMRERVQNALGSGVIVSREGIVVTNNHVVEGGEGTLIKIALSDLREYDAEVILKDKETDIAVLRIRGGDGKFPYLEFQDSDALQVGDLVLAIGNPFGVGQTVTSGIVSALARTGVTRSDAQVFIQTDAAINPGNSGGALVDVDGRLVGINTAIFSKSGGSMGIGFAIPSNLVRLYVESALSGRPVQRPWLGATLEPLDRGKAAGLGLRRVAGAFVSRVYDNGPAEKAGLLPGDVITGVDGFPVSDPRAVLYRLTTTGVGRSAVLDVVRRGRTSQVKLVIAAPPKPGPGDVRNLSGDHPFDGARVGNILPGMAERLELDQGVGVVILSVRRGSVANRLGFQTGDIILQVNDERVSRIDDLSKALGTRASSWQLAIQRRGRVLRLQVRN